MLVLSRKANESIVVNHNITVTIVEIRGDKVRLGIVHPKEVSVHRQEVYELIKGTESRNSLPSVQDNEGAASRPVGSSIPQLFANPGFQVQHRLSFERSAPEARQVIAFAAGLGKPIPDSERIDLDFSHEEWNRLLAHFGSV